MTKKIISLILVAAMMLTILPLSASAEINVDDYLVFSGFPTEWTNEHSDFSITAKAGVTAMTVNGVSVPSVGGTAGGGVVAENGKPYVKYKALSYDEATGILEIGAFLGNVNAGAGFFTFKYDKNNWAPVDINRKSNHKGKGETLTVFNATHKIASCLVLFFDTEEDYLPEDSVNPFKINDTQYDKFLELQTDKGGDEFYFESIELPSSGTEGASVSLDTGVAHISWHAKGYKFDSTDCEIPIFRFQLKNKGNATIGETTIVQPVKTELATEPIVNDDSSTYLNVDGEYKSTVHNNLDYIFETLDGTMYGCAQAVPGTIKYEGNTSASESFKVDITVGGKVYSKTYSVLVDKIAPTLEVKPEEITNPVKKAVFTITSSDDKSGIDKVLVNDQPFTGDKYETDVVGTYIFKAIDKAGNETKVTRTVGEGMIDKEGPEITVEGNPTEWVAQDFPVALYIITNEPADIYVDSVLIGSNVTGIDFPKTENEQRLFENGTYKITAVDALGNKTEKEITVDKIDREGPQITVTGLPIDWVKEATLEIVVEDEISGVDEWKFTSTAKPKHISGNTYVLDSPDDFVIEAYDIAGNLSVFDRGIQHFIDNVAPSFEVSPAPSSAVKQHTFEITDANDNQSGLEKITVSIDGGAEQTVQNNKVVATKSGTYVFTAYDKVGNTTVVTRTIAEGLIDNEKPEVKVEGAPSASEWQNKDVTLTVTVNETAKVDAYKDGQLIAEAIGTSFLVTETGTYKFKATDVAGNVGESEEYEISIDKIAPTLELSAPLPTGWSSSFFLSFSYGDQGGSRMQSFTINGEEFNGTYEITANGPYEVILTDGAGNTARWFGEISIIDEYEPVIGNVSALPSDWVKSYTLTFTANDGETNISRVKVHGETVQAVSGVYSYLINEDGDYLIEVWDGAGNLKEHTFSIYGKIDNEKPVVTEPLVGTEPVQEYTFKITAEDLKSGVVRVTVNNSNAVYNETEDVWEFTVDANGSYEFLAYDKVGNVSEPVSVEVTNIDNDNPVITPSFNDAWTNQNVEITLSVNKEIVSLTVSKDGGAPVTVENFKVIAEDNGEYVFTAQDVAGNVGTAKITITKIDKVNPQISISNPPAGFHKEFSVDITASDDKTANVKVTVSKDNGAEAPVSGTTYPVKENGTYKFTATDDAGNTDDYTIVVDNIDNEKPVIAEPVYNKEWAKQVVITLNVTDNKSDASNITITIDGVPYDPSGFVATENKAYAVVAIDEAGNKEETSINITNIDNEAPSVELSDAPTEWTNQFTFSITAHDYNKSGVASIKVNANAIQGTTYEVTANGTYTVVVADVLGNETEKSITVDKFDNVKPTLEVSAEPSVWTKEHTFTLSNKGDDLSGVKEVTVNGVKFDGEEYKVTARGEYKFVITDNAGNKTEIIRNAEKIDETAPVFAGAIAVTDKTDSQITVSLPQATDDSNETIAYELYIDGVKVDTYAGELNYTLTNVVAGTEYTVKLVAKDIVARETPTELKVSLVELGKVQVNIDLSELNISAETLHMNVVIEGGATVSVDKFGKALIENLAEGTYKLTFKAAGFLPVAKAELVVKNGETTTVNFEKADIIAGDTTDDGRIDIYDLNAVASAFAESYSGGAGLVYDFNRDGKVNKDDIIILVANYNKAAQQ